MKINIILVLTILICSYLNAETTIYINSKISKENIINYAMDENNDSGFVLNLGEDVKVSSELKKNKNINYVGKNLADFNLNTAWIEGKNDYGIGEDIEFDFKRFSLIGLKRIYIYNGYCKNKKVWEENSRVKKMNLYINNSFYGILELEDTINEQYFDIYCKSEIQRIKFEIIEVYSGKKYKDTAISEIFFEENVRCFPVTTKITLSDNAEKTIDQIKSGDEILTYNLSAKKFVKTKVLSVAKVEHDNLVEIDFGDRVITSTDDHPYLSDKGWKSCKPNGTKQYKGYENVKEMKTGDKIYFIGKDEKYELKEIKGIKRVDKKEMCYTITKLKNGDNFIADGAVVGVEEIK